MGLPIIAARVFLVVYPAVYATVYPVVCPTVCLVVCPVVEHLYDSIAYGYNPLLIVKPFDFRQYYDISWNGTVCGVVTLQKNYHIYITDCQQLSTLIAHIFS